MSGATSLGAIDIIAFVPTADSSRSRAFYEGVLGLRFVKDDGLLLFSMQTGL
jgi:catechol 2,3-dioxygenase-like lactoylglutathione lyase family enzyme